MNEFSAIKVNFRDKNKKPTSTTINFNICKYYCERLGTESDFNTDLTRKDIKKIIQFCVNNYRKDNPNITKDYIEQRLLHESTIATIRNYIQMINAPQRAGN